MDPIGTRPVHSANRTQGVTVPRAARTAAPVDGEDANSVEASAIALSETAAKSPPVDTDRVAQIRAAISNGTFPIQPPQIADRLIALKLNWSPHDQA